MMAIKEPESMDELIYFTKRAVGNGSVRCWVYKQDCTECGKAKMGKPVDGKTGKVKIRAKEYVCPECNHTVEKQEHEETLTAEIEYTCPKCNAKGEAEIPFKRKKVALINEETGKKKMVEALQFSCEKCDEKINITKKMK